MAWESPAAADGSWVGTARLAGGVRSAVPTGAVVPNASGCAAGAAAICSALCSGAAGSIYIYMKRSDQRDNIVILLQ